MADRAVSNTVDGNIVWVQVPFPRLVTDPGKFAVLRQFKMTQDKLKCPKAIRHTTILASKDELVFPE